MIAGILIILIIVVPVSVLWVRSIDKATESEAWKRYKEEEDKEQLEFFGKIQEATRREAEKEEKGAIAWQQN